MEWSLLAIWVVLFAVLYLVALPIAALVFAELPDRGVGFALPTGVVAYGLAGYWLGHVSFDRTTAVGTLVLVAVTSLVARRLGPKIPRRRAVEGLAVFLCAFLVLAALRAVHPVVDPTRSEAFLDFGLFKSLLRAPALPPETFWLANESVSYYYGGHLFGALFTLLTGTPPRMAYTLSVAGFGAMLVATVYELASAVAVTRNVPRRAAGLVAIYFAVVASNLTATFWTVLGSVVGLFPVSVRAPVARGLASALGSSSERVLAGASALDRMSGLRVVPGAITEFPLFSILQGDLHAHVTSAPLVVFAAALTFAYAETPEHNVRRRRALVFAAAPAAGGLVAVVDTWALPTVFGVLWLGLSLARPDPWSLLPVQLAHAIDRRIRDGGRLGREAARPAVALALAGVAGLLASLLAAPYLLGVGGRSIAVLPPSARSPLLLFVLVHGVFLATFGGYLLGWFGMRDRSVLVGSVVILVVAVASGHTVFAVVAPLLVAVWVAGRSDRIGFEGVLAAAGLGLVLLVEYGYVVESAGGLRTNTVFRAYYQTWVLWSVAIGVVIPALAAGRLPAATALGRLASDGRRWRWLRTGVAGALVLSTATYGAFVVPPYLDHADDGLTLDGLQYADEEYPAQLAAVGWLDDRVDGRRPTIISAPVPKAHTHQWNAATGASLTGLPTVVGWQDIVDYRGEATTYRRRADAVDWAYRGTDCQRAAVLVAYDVKYVYVGPYERNRYGSIRSFDSLPGVSLAFENDRVVVYAVDQGALTAAVRNESVVGSRPATVDDAV